MTVVSNITRVWWLEGVHQHSISSWQWLHCMTCVNNVRTNWVHLLSLTNWMKVSTHPETWCCTSSPSSDNNQQSLLWNINWLILSLSILTSDFIIYLKQETCSWQYSVQVFSCYSFTICQASHQGKRISFLCIYERILHCRLLHDFQY